MTYARPKIEDDTRSLPRMPGWATARGPADAEDLAFRSGAALATLHQALSQPEVPGALLRDRLALGAAAACTGFVGRPTSAADLRDEVHLLRPGDLPGPAGAILAAWRQAVARPISKPRLQGCVDAALRDSVPLLLGGVAGVNPVAQGAQVLESALSDHPMQEASALILADAVLARALGWDHVVPLLAAGLKRRDLALTGDDLGLACHRAVLTSATEALHLAGDLARRAARLRAVAPKLRAKGAAAAVELFLARDALSPSLALTRFMTDRAARRLCDRLVELGAVQELTGRPSFRLYGV